MKFRISPTTDQIQIEIEQLRKAVEELTVLNDLAITASSAMEVNQMLDIVVEKSIKAMDAEQGSILLVTPQAENPLQTLIRQPDQKSRFMNYKVGSHITGWVLKNNSPLIIENLASDSRFQTTEEEKKEIKTVLSVPIQFQGRLIGLLTVTNKKSAVSFSNSDLRLLSIIAAQSAQLIKNSQLQQEVIEKNRLKQELELARKIQQELLPKSPPEFPFLEFATFFNPAEEVGGDFFDYIPLSQERLAVVQADVSGHGLSAALIMTMLKGIFQSISHDFISPEQTLTQINEILGNSAPPEIFVTMIFLVFDSEKRVLHITNAGHNPPLVYLHKEEKLEYLKIPGCALNCMKSAEYCSHKISLNAGDFIFLYTDGLPESPDKQFELFGYERLQKIVHEARDTDVKNILQEVKTALYRHLQQVPQTDDIAINILKVN